MKFFAAENLVSPAVVECKPWEFKPTMELTPQIRAVKEDRQAFYQSQTTKHNFYTGIEAANPNARVSKENPPRRIWTLVADYDLPVDNNRLAEVLPKMPYRPERQERSLGGNFRLIWTLEIPIPTEDQLFCTFVLQRAKVWLGLDMLPGLDSKAFEACTRLYCNGCDWADAGGKPILSKEVQAFFVECGKKYRFRADEDATVPLDIVEKALREKYPNFDWPGTFDLGTQGPSFWIPESLSPQSALVKEGGIFTFSQHATKPFYSWTDLLGPQFTSQYQADAIAKATADVFWDAKRFFRKKEGLFVSLDAKELQNYFKVTCRISTKPNPSGISQMDLAFEHIYNHQFVSGAVPAIFQPPGLIIVQNRRVLNTYAGKPVEPAPGTQKWGPHGNFAFWSKIFDSLYDPKKQLEFFLAWHKHFYTSAFEWKPRPGSNFTMAGAAGIGKTLVNRQCVGVSVGGFVDASNFLVEGETFNSHLLEKPLWCLDDDAPAGSAASQARMRAQIKKCAANQEFLHNAKFEKATMGPWNGRIGITTNLDFVSTRIIGALDNTSLDKMSLFRCVAEKQFIFPNRDETLRLCTTELPYYLRWLLDWEPPDYVLRDPRYGYAAYQEETLLTRSHQSSSIAPFKELLLETLAIHFAQNKNEAAWEGNITTLVRMMEVLNPANASIMRTIRLEQVSRYLEAIQREGLLKIEVKDGPHRTRIFRFLRPTDNDTH